MPSARISLEHRAKFWVVFNVADARCDTADELTAIFLPGTYVGRKFEGKEGVMSKRSTARMPTDGEILCFKADSTTVRRPKI